MQIQKEDIQNTFARYVAGFDLTQEGVAAKYHHSLIVAGLCERIARGLQLSDDDVALAWLIGILHDIGRFEQLRRYQTFVDYKSMDHAQYGVHYLFDDGHIRDFLADNSEDDVIRAAIGSHNAYALPEGLDKRQTLFSRIIRDADKIDIFRVYAGFLARPEAVWGVTLADMMTQRISPAVMEEARQRQLVHTQRKKTAVDFLTGCLCFWFDIQFEVSRQLIREQGYFLRLLTFTSAVPEINEQLGELRRLIMTNC